MTPVHHFAKQSLHPFNALSQGVQLRKLLLIQGAPALRCRSDAAKAKKQLADFVQREAELAGALNDR